MTLLHRLLPNSDDKFRGSMKMANTHRAGGHKLNLVRENYDSSSCREDEPEDGNVQTNAGNTFTAQMPQRRKISCFVTACTPKVVQGEQI
ncbi:hypothetical protein TNCV_4159881 [Trichonephila clavipes]|nr:hypothetical protein TNCV_4159881 [Trichonephila clavipes]